MPGIIPPPWRDESRGYAFISFHELDANGAIQWVALVFLDKRELDNPPVRFQPEFGASLHALVRVPEEQHARLQWISSGWASK